jgi:23S rRNA U2552 (ribose-2'-O)-methylase RlmE/FtsJ
MSRRVVIIGEQADTSGTFTDTQSYTIYDIAQTFIGFARKYRTLEEAIDNLSIFVDEVYRGNDVATFKNIIRSGYKELIDEVLEGSRSALERRVVKVI